MVQNIKSGLPTPSETRGENRLIWTLNGNKDFTISTVKNALQNGMNGATQTDETDNFMRCLGNLAFRKKM